MKSSRTLVTALAALALVPATASASDQVAIGTADGIQVVEVRDANAATLARLERAEGVEFAEAAMPTRATAAMSFAEQWGLANTGQTGGTFDADIDAPGAWALAGTGSASTLVAFADSGVAFDHDGLQQARFPVNEGETGVAADGSDKATNGVDDDRNGCVDDVRGCDELDGSGSADDDNGHGTGTAGVVLATGRYDGVAPGVTATAVKVLDAGARGTTAALATGLDRVARQGARVVNVSVAGPRSEAVHRAIADHPGTLFVVAAGNDAQDVDAAPSFPCADPSPNVICVAASNARDTLASFSNRGATSVDVAAPGAAVAGLTRDATTTNLNGTSFAAPMVTGIAALAFSARPDATVAEVRDAILGGVDRLPALQGKVATSGRVNAHRTIATLLGVAFAERDVRPALAAQSASPAAAAPAATATPVARTHAATTTAATPASTSSPRAAAAEQTVPLSGIARRQGARRIVVQIRCAAGVACGTVKVRAAGSGATAKVAAGKQRTVTLTVKRAKAVKQVVLTASGRSVKVALTR